MRSSRLGSSPKRPATDGGLTTVLRPRVPCLDLEDAKVVELEYGDAAVEKAKLAKLFDMLPPEESDALKVKYGLVGLQ